MGARSELNNGQTLADTIELSTGSLVVLDKLGLPLSRLWCLYEIASTPAAKLSLLTHGFEAAEVARQLPSVDVMKAGSYDKAAETMIRNHVVLR